MRHITARIKKRKPLKLFTKQKLHSKSTYFYLIGPLFRKKVSNLQKHLVRFCSEKRDSRNKTNNYMNLEHNGYSSTYILPVLCASTLLLVLGCMINPTIYSSDKGYALEGGSGNGVEGADGSAKEEVEEEVEAQENVMTLADNGIATQAELTSDTNGASVSLIVDNGVITDTILADTGATTYRSHTITVKGDNIESYTMQISATSNGTSELQRDGGGFSIAGANGKKGSELSTNTWGYGWGDVNTNDADLTYYTLPAYGTASSSISNGLLESVQNIQTDSVNTTKKLTFAANFGDDVPEGHYTTSVMLSLAVEPKKMALYDEPTGFNSGADIIYNMQDMTTSICSTADNGTTGRLRDIRDDKVYWVAKINGVCWMTQNLDLDLNKDVNLTSANTDIAHSIALNTTQTKTINFATGAGTVQSFDPGYYVYAPISATAACTTADLSNCAGWVNMLRGTWKASTDPSFTGSIDDATGTYNAHYLVGNYYSYAAATAGSGPSGSGTAEHSICPRGWKLPTGGGGGEMQAIFNGMGASALIVSPYYFVYTGDINGGSIFSAGSEGRVWSSTTSSNKSSEAYALYYYSSSLNTVNDPARYKGNAVRCIAR